MKRLASTAFQLFSMVFAAPHLFDHLLGIEGPDLDQRARGYLEALEQSTAPQIANLSEAAGGRLCEVV